MASPDRNFANSAIFTQTASGTIPNAGDNSLYFKSDNNIYSKNSSGVETQITPAAGTVTSVTGTSPITSSGGATPAISIAAASTTVSGAVQLTDSTSSTSTTTAATPNSVKSAYDLANGKAGTAQANTFTQPQIITGTNDTTAMLRITQEGQGEAIRVEDSATPDSTAFVVNKDGRVGIGTAPDATVALKLDSTGVKFNDGTVQTTAFIGGVSSTDVQIFSTAGTWTKPTGAKLVEFICVGGGGGGGAGAKVLGASAVYGGLGGSSGGLSRITIDGTQLNDATYTITVGVGGTGAIYGGAAAGNATSTTVVGATDGRIAGVNMGGVAPNGGTSLPTNTFAGIPMGNLSGAASITATAGNSGINNFSPQSGAAGGGCSTLAAFAGGASTNPFTGASAAGGANTGANGTAVTAKTQSSLIFNGSGGSGGGGSITSNGGNGGNATGYGCGGGGGGSCSSASAFVGGNGGNGASGVVVITTYF